MLRNRFKKFLCLLTGFAALAFAKFGFAVTQDSTQWWDHRLRLQLPVAWEISRSDFLSESLASQTESFHETWNLQFGPGADIFLASPRGRVKVGPTNLTKAGYPRFVVLVKEDFAQLLGVPSDQLAADEPLPIQPELIALPLLPQAKPLEVHLYVTKADYFTVHWDLTF